MSIASETTLRITEIFFSLQGESTRVGLPTVFIRLTGCPLRCGYCDTAYAFTGGLQQSIAVILEDIAQYQTRYITVTGGEPLAQKACLTLLSVLCDQGYSVSLETSGALDVSQVDARVSKIMDIKTPGSGEVERNDWANLGHLTQQDELKFVLCDEQDYKWAYEVVKTRDLTSICTVLFSPAYNVLDPTTLAEWMLQDQIPVRMQLQLHKLLWGVEAGR